ncbi:hypothetical protein [Microbulbifer guangxiensis]|uniref:hypothetical protein n=1 Tax=Microbulbifer guangxiensis TaxID=2904249 RepID=UPI001F1C2C8C|nr:hypothetical protein [Microbulbifer guangxiensis]
MKYIFPLILLAGLCACAVSEEKQAAIKVHEEAAKAAERRAQVHGTLPGTPENIEGIERARKQARNERAAARELKKTPISDFFDGIFDAVFKQEH